MKIAIIGGSGFIGTRLTRRLLKAGHEVVIIDKAQSVEFGKLWRYGDVRFVETLVPPLKGCEVIYNLAAEHSDVVSPVTLYEEVNVGGAENVCKAALALGIRKIIFTSSVAVYGSAPFDIDENGELNPNNPYGQSKKLAESVYRSWLRDSFESSLVVVRPTVVFGENNRGNVYNLLKQIAGGKFLMIGNGKNRKSMAYVENVAAFLEYVLIYEKGENTFNYIDKPDFNMNDLVLKLKEKMGRTRRIWIRIPYSLGLSGGYVFDLISWIIGKRLPISSARIKKFSQNTLFSSSKLDELYFQAPVKIEQGLEKTIQHEFICDKK